MSYCFGGELEMTDKITLELTLDELKLIDKYIELNDETQSVFDKIKYAYPQPQMNLRQEGEYAVVSYHDKVYYRLESDVTFLWYIKKGVSVTYPVPTLVMVEDAETERLLEGLYYNHIQVKKEKVVEEPEDNEWKSVALRFGEKLSGYLSDGYYELSPAAWFRWAVFTYGKGQQIKDAVRESKKWCEENPDKDPLDCLKPQTPEQVADGLKEAFREAVKQGVVSSTKPQTLYDVIADWWDDTFTKKETSLQELVDAIEEWLPKEQSAAGSQNAYVECTVEGFNDCLNKIKRKLR